jgi:hypothetical protein
VVQEEVEIEAEEVVDDAADFDDDEHCCSDRQIAGVLRGADVEVMYDGDVVVGVVEIAEVDAEVVEGPWIGQTSVAVGLGDEDTCLEP